MTITDRNELVDSLEEVSVTLEKAQYIMQGISEEFFERFDPNDKDGKFGIVYEFRRWRALSRILRDLLHQIESELPSSDWASSLKAEEDGEVEGVYS